MPLELTAHGVSSGALTLSFGQFPPKVQSHGLRVPTTESLERSGALVLDRSADVSVSTFVQDVCQWGGHAEIGGRVLRANTPEALGRQLAAATEALTSSADASTLVRAIGEVNELHQLNRPSYASMLLRFLRPDVCATLERTTAETFGYEFDASGFAAYSLDCAEIAKRLMAAKIQNPRVKESRWPAADVDMALIALLRHW
jgi:hypothetical protein